MNYIDISEIPIAERGRKYPYDDWTAIPEGQAVEITHLVSGGLSPTNVSGAINIQSKKRGLGLAAMRRGDRVWIARPRKS